MACFINLPVRWAYDQPAWIDWFVGGGISPELGLDPLACQLPDSWHKETAARFRDAGLSCGAHLPFAGIDPCDTDPAAAEAARQTLVRGAELARIYGAEHMIAHPYYQDNEGSEKSDLQAWITASLPAWKQLPAIGGAPLFLENTYETSPGAVSALVAALASERGGIGVCFDVGHWRSFAGCAQVEELDAWLDVFIAFPLHLHLHDNDGTADQHRGFGDGDIDFEGLFARLESHGKRFGVTLEPHDVASFTQNIEWLEKHTHIARRIGWVKPRLEALPLGLIEKNLAT